jgi:hypothetical protein
MDIVPFYFLMVPSLRWRFDGLLHLPDIREYLTISPFLPTDDSALAILD